MKRISIKGVLEEIRSAPTNLQHLAVFVLLVGIHSLILGIFIFFFTESFYWLFFQANIENFFFVRQAGLFLFCLGLFDIAVLKEVRKYYTFIKVIIATKVLAFLFLMSNGHLAVWPPIIFLAALGDGFMALVLIYLYRRADFKTTNREW
ncbi:MAG: hypothetical protein ABFD82_00320 [Syntrophaceae bacterium]